MINKHDKQNGDYKVIIFTSRQKYYRVLAAVCLFCDMINAYRATWRHRYYVAYARAYRSSNNGTFMFTSSLTFVLQSFLSHRLVTYLMLSSSTSSRPCWCRFISKSIPVDTILFITVVVFCFLFRFSRLCCINSDTKYVAHFLKWLIFSVKIERLHTT